ncbi:MAG TPA: N-methyl-L-tryptophan oxidase [Xanthobacteraceae bacterium]|jgi:sarcosine oxidase|nr:N-methyl-L-tryptophan oxidase [Xanthobacteraceae bacterium]
MPAFDVAVIGLGVMGSAALAALARRGCRAVGIDRFALGHDRGSSHGTTRVIRLGYFEHPSYVPLLRAAYALWRELEAQSGRSLLTITGIVEIGAPESDLVAGTLRSSRLHGLPHEILDALSLMKRFPAFRVPDDFIGVFQPDGGIVRAEGAIEALQELASGHGAEIIREQKVLAVEPYGDGVRATTECGEVLAGCAVVAAGPWLKSLLPQFPAPIRVTRQVVGWFAPANHARAVFAAGRFPVFLLQNPDGLFYGFPADANGVKVAKHHHLDEAADPDRHDRTVSAADEAAIRKMLKAHLPEADGRLVAAQTCLYTMTPDSDFIVDRLPGCPGIIVAAPCSGHGFKFAPVIGEILADLAVAGGTHHDISRFLLKRFA